MTGRSMTDKGRVRDTAKDAVKDTAGVAGKGRIAVILSWAAVILWMLFIFYLSSQVAEQSNQLSTGITQAIMKLLGKLAPGIEPDLNSFNYFVRKNAHFMAYLLLGLLSYNAMGKSRLHSLRSALFALLICVLYAISDEVHQLFVPGRGGQVTDVLIDSAGAMVGIGLYFIVMRLRHRSINT